MKPAHRRILALVLGGGLVLLLVGGQQWLENLPLAKPDQVTVRKVDLAAPPPPAPPPPPPRHQPDSISHAAAIDVTGSGAGIELGRPELDAPLTQVQPPAPHINAAPQWQKKLAVNWDAFGLSELDQLPQLISSPRTHFPPSLVRRGITQVTVKLDVLIDEQGRVTLRRVRHNPYPALQPLIHQVVQQARFSSPTKQGAPVRAVFTWPLEFAQ